MKTKAMLEYEKRLIEKKKDGYIIHFAEFKRQTEWEEKQYHWDIYWRGRKICEQPKNDINIVVVRGYYNKIFTQYQMSL